MKFLKRKIQAKLNINGLDYDSETSNPPPTKKGKKGPGRRHRKKRFTNNFRASEKARSTKNLIKNYARAICTFAHSNIAEPYLLPLVEKEKISLERFCDYMYVKKEEIDTIKTFRAALTINEEDSEEEKAFKRIFKEMGIIFIKYFSVNWIFSGKVTYTKTYLKFRHKMLRRIKNPELFVSLAEKS